MLRFEVFSIFLPLKEWLLKWFLLLQRRVNRQSSWQEITTTPLHYRHINFLSSPLHLIVIFILLILINECFKQIFLTCPKPSQIFQQRIDFSFFKVHIHTQNLREEQTEKLPNHSLSFTCPYIHKKYFQRLLRCLFYENSIITRRRQKKSPATTKMELWNVYVGVVGVECIQCVTI